MTAQQSASVPRRRRFVAGSIYVFEHITPDPFVLAISLTFLVAAAALLIAPHGDPATIVSSWYSGMFGILGFALQMILILATAHVLAHAPVVHPHVGHGMVKRALRRRAPANQLLGRSALAY